MFTSEATAESGAPSEAVWQLFQDVPRWPQWYLGYRAAGSDGPLGPGGRGTVVLANGRPRQFEVVEWTPGAALSFGTRSLGTTLRFRYSVRPTSEGGSTLTIGHTLEGPTSGFFGWLFGRRIAASLPEAAVRLARLAEQPQGAVG